MTATSSSSSSSSTPWSELKVITPDQVSAFTYDAVDTLALEQARPIVMEVKTKGLEAVRAHAFRLGDLASPESQMYYTPEELEAVYLSCSKEVQQVLHRVASRIEAFAKLQRTSVRNVNMDIPGGQAGQDVEPVMSAGCYAPGGRYPLPSSVLMTAITARCAGVSTVIVASPRPSNVTLAAAHVAQVDGLLAVGGAQAIAALAYGCQVLTPDRLIPACDIIVGPGNKWVTAAKSLVSGKCAIDMLAGPSECLVIADDSASAEIIAADLLAQAEHDTAAVPILVTTCADLIGQVNAELKAQLSTLSTAEVANVSVKNGFAVLCPDMKSCIAVSNTLAPEHLEVMVRDLETVVPELKHYGGLFIGPKAAEVFGDYGVGPNHVLPTGGTARYTGGLSVHTFLRIRTWMRMDKGKSRKDEQLQVIADSAQLARMEGLEGHALAAEKRLGLF